LDERFAPGVSEANSRFVVRFQKTALSRGILLLGENRVEGYDRNSNTRIRQDKAPPDGVSAGKKRPGHFMCMSGCIPQNVPVENELYYNEVHKELSKR
jgi:hypothetical protein